MTVHRVEPQIQEAETRQGGDGGEGIMVHQAVARQVKLPEAGKKDEADFEKEYTTT